MKLIRLDGVKYLRNSSFNFSGLMLFCHYSTHRPTTSMNNAMWLIWALQRQRYLRREAKDRRDDLPNLASVELLQHFLPVI